MNDIMPRDTDDRLDRLFDIIASIDKRLAVVESRISNSGFTPTQWLVIVGALSLAGILAGLLLREGL